jgi:hypothetical protein
MEDLNEEVEAEGDEDGAGRVEAEDQRSREPSRSREDKRFSGSHARGGAHAHHNDGGTGRERERSVVLSTASVPARRRVAKAPAESGSTALQLPDEVPLLIYLFI